MQILSLLSYKLREEKLQGVCDSGQQQSFEPAAGARSNLSPLPSSITVVVTFFPENRMCVKDILAVLRAAFLIMTAALKKQSSQLLPHGL